MSPCLKLPGAFNFVHRRIPVVLGVVARVQVGIVYLAYGFGVHATLTLAFALLLALVYHVRVQAVLMSRQ